MFRRPSSRGDFRFAIICALPLEYDAVYDSFDEIWKPTDFGKADGDPNRYTTGRMANIALVLVLLPEMGTISAASAAASLRSSYPNLNLALLVGVCGAVPKFSDGTEVILGDVIISKYVVRYDFGRQYPDGFKAKKTVEDTLGRPNKESRVLSAQLETRSGRDELAASAQDNLQNLQEKVESTKYRGLYNYVGVANDQLFNPGYRHKHQISTCAVCNACRSSTDPVCEQATESKCVDLGCNERELIYRHRLSEQQGSSERTVPPALAIHVGGIGSADTVMKSADMRDRLAKRERVIGFEMEGAGAWDELASCIVVKGVCDYADSHKSKGWQKYAAATAASAAKALLRSYFADGRSEDQSHGRTFFIPFGDNEDFVGRTAIIESLVERLSDHTIKSHRMAMYGMGGVGKTQIALKIAHAIKQQHPDRNIFWLPAYSMAGFEQTCSECVDKLKLPKASGNDSKEVFCQYLNSSDAGRWLLVLDNADDEEVLRGSDGKPGIYNYLPKSQSGQTLVTTRWKKIAVDFAKKNVFAVAEMAPEDARNLLDNSLTFEGRSWNNVIVDELLHLLVYLPLAIVQAAAYMDASEMRIDDYLTLCRDSQQEMMGLMHNRYEDDTFYHESQYAVATTWLISFKQIEKQSEEAAKLLRFMTWVQPQAIPCSMLPDMGPRRIKAIGVLKSYAFIRERPEGGIFDMHSLVHMVLQSWANERGIVQSGKEEVICHLAKIFQSDRWEDRDIWRLQLPHAAHVINTSAKALPLLQATIGYWVGRCLYKDGRIKHAVALLDHVVKILETLLEEDHSVRLASQQALAGAYLANGDINDATTLLEHIVKIRETTLEEDHPDRLESQRILACAYLAKGRHTKDAIALLEYVVKVHKTTLEEGHPVRLASQHELAGAYLANRDINNAITLLEHVVKIEETTLEEDHPERLASQHELARAYLANGDTNDATTLLEHVVKIQETTLKEDHPVRLASQHELARAYLANGDINDAITLLEHVVKIRETTLEEDHLDRLASQHVLASAYLAKGRHTKDAVTLLEHVVKLRETTLEEGHPLRLASQHELARAYLTNGDINDAITLLEHVVKIQETTLKEGHPLRLASQHELARAYLANGDINNAITLLDYVVKIEETTLEEDHPERLASQHELARAYLTNGDINDAITLLEHVVKIQETTLKEGHPLRLASQHELARAYRASGQIKDTIALFE